LAAGELPPFGPGGDALQQLQQQPLQRQPSGSLDFLPKCSGVLNRVYMACNTIQPMFGLHAKDVFYRPVRETFPNIAADYYARISHPMTFRTIEERISKGFYVNAQMFADVSFHGAARWRYGRWRQQRLATGGGEGKCRRGCPSSRFSNNRELAP
jgi:hypothetical protein